MAFAEGLERLSDAVVEASGREERWLERLRAGLVALLGFLDDEPKWRSPGSELSTGYKKIWR